MRFSSKIILTIACTVAVLCLALGGLTYHVLLPYYQKQFIDRYMIQSDVIRDTFIETEKLTEKIAANALFTLQTLERLHGLSSQEDLVKWAGQLHVSNIYFTDQHGHFIRWAHGVLNNHQRSIFDHCDDYRLLLQHSTPTIQQTPLLPSAGDISPGLFKFFMMANASKTGLIEVSIAVEYIGTILQRALQQDDMIQSIQLFSSTQQQLATIHATRPLNEDKTLKRPEGIYWEHDFLEIVTAIPMSISSCCECLEKGTTTTAQDNLYYLLIRVNTSAFNQAFLQIKKKLLLVFLLVGLASLGVVAYLTQWMLHRLHVIIEQIKQRSEGNTTLRLTTTGSDEIASMGKEINQLIDSLEASKHALVESTRAAALGEMASQVAHDIRSPLAALLTILDDLRHPTEQTRTLLRKAIFRIQNIANDLLDVRKSTFQALGEDLAPTYVQFASWIEEMVLEKQAEYRQYRGITFHFQNHDPEKKAYIIFSPVQLQRMISNIINNAVEATYPKGHILIEMFHDNVHVKVQITDSGTGIPTSVMERLGELNNTTKWDGNGMGLTHAIHMVRQYHGEMSVRNGCCGGGQITIQFPMAQPPP